MSHTAHKITHPRLGKIEVANLRVEPNALNVIVTAVNGNTMEDYDRDTLRLVSGYAELPEELNFDMPDEVTCIIWPKWDTKRIDPELQYVEDYPSFDDVAKVFPDQDGAYTLSEYKTWKDLALELQRRHDELAAMAARWKDCQFSPSARTLMQCGEDLARTVEGR